MNCSKKRKRKRKFRACCMHILDESRRRLWTKHSAIVWYLYKVKFLHATYSLREFHKRHYRAASACFELSKLSLKIRGGWTHYVKRAFYICCRWSKAGVSGASLVCTEKCRSEKARLFCLYWVMPCDILLELLGQHYDQSPMTLIFALLVVYVDHLSSIFNYADLLLCDFN